MQVEDTRNYRVSEVAEHYRVAASTVYRAIKSGQLKALKVGGGALRVPGHAVRAYAETCTQAVEGATEQAAPRASNSFEGVAR